MITVDKYSKKAIAEKSHRCAACGTEIPDVATTRIGFMGKNRTTFVNVCTPHAEYLSVRLLVSKEKVS